MRNVTIAILILYILSGCAIREDFNEMDAFVSDTRARCKPNGVSMIVGVKSTIYVCPDGTLRIAPDGYTP